MALETRNGRIYCYRSRRIDGRVVREYVAAGDAAVQAAKRDQEDRELLRREHEQDLKQLGTLDEITALLRTVIESNNIILAASLLAAGFHQHRGEWRQSHDRKSRKDD